MHIEVNESEGSPISAFLKNWANIIEPVYKPVEVDLLEFIQRLAPKQFNNMSMKRKNEIRKRFRSVKSVLVSMHVEEAHQNNISAVTQ